MPLQCHDKSRSLHGSGAEANYLAEEEADSPVSFPGKSKILYGMLYWFGDFRRRSEINASVGPPSVWMSIGRDRLRFLIAVFGHQEIQSLHCDLARESKPSPVLAPFMRGFHGFSMLSFCCAACESEGRHLALAAHSLLLGMGWQKFLVLCRSAEEQILSSWADCSPTLKHGRILQYRGRFI